MSHTVAEIAAALNAQAEGDVTIRIDRAAEPAEAGRFDIALALSPKYAADIANGSASAAILWPGADWRQMGLRAAIFVGHARYGMADLSALLDRGPEIAAGIHPLAVIDATAEIGADAAIAPLVVIGPRVRIGPGATIGPGTTIGRDTTIGARAVIHAGVKIAHEVNIGDRFVAQSGAVIGSDGFSFVPPEGLDIEGTRRSLGEGHKVWKGGPANWRRVHSVGGVEIGDDVEVGANSAIDRGTIRATRIGRGTKIDNLVHVGHNVTVGEDTLLCGQVGIAGSSRIGNRCVLGGQVGVNDNITVGDDVIAAGATNIYTSAPAGRVLMGSPATKMETQIESYKAVRRLPRLFAQVAALQKAVSKLRETD